jgi:Na+-transporting NADH:ubiquinone oxidoreductase subunit NqrC
MDILNVISVLALIVSVLVMAYQTALLSKQVKEDHEWRRREKSLAFARMYHPTVREALQKLIKAFGYFQMRETPFTREELNKVFETDPLIREDVNQVLSWLEMIGIAVKHNIASVDVVYDMMGHTYINYEFVFRSYIKIWTFEKR